MRMSENTSQVHAAVVKTQQNTPEAAVYSQYFDHTEPLSRFSGHRALAVFRAQRAGPQFLLERARLFEWQLSAKSLCRCSGMLIHLCASVSRCISLYRRAYRRSIVFFCEKLCIIQSGPS